jgi:hypothetical protein
VRLTKIKNGLKGASQYELTHTQASTMKTTDGRILLKLEPEKLSLLISMSFLFIPQVHIIMVKVCLPFPTAHRGGRMKTTTSFSLLHIVSLNQSRRMFTAKFSFQRQLPKAENLFVNSHSTLLLMAMIIYKRESERGIFNT